MYSLREALPKREQAIVPAFGCGSAAPVIPALGAHFRPFLTLGQNEEEAAWASLSLEVLPFLASAQVRGNETATTAVRMAVQQWASDQLIPGVGGANYTVSSTPPESYAYRLSETGQDDQLESSFYLSLDVAYQGLLSIGARMEALHSVSPAYARVVMAVLQTAADRSLWTVTPSEILAMCSYTHWMGEEDETLMIEENIENLDDQEEVEALRSSMICRADFDEQFPSWALSTPTLLEGWDAATEVPAPSDWMAWAPWRDREFDGEHADLCRKVQQLCNTVVDLIQSGARLIGRVCDSGWGDSVGAYLILLWKPSSEHLVCQVYDDMAELAHQSYAISETVVIGIDKAGDLLSTLNQLASGLELTRALVALLNALEENEQNHVHLTCAA